MSDQEKFLTRWSRRKRDTADENARAEQPTAADDSAKQEIKCDQSIVTRPRESEAPPAPGFDLTKLPSLESIGANSDITAFLQPGVPSALKHAALRRAWAADPAIRDFVGLAENAWDFTDPEAMVGFGGLDPKYDVKKIVAEIFGQAGPKAEPPKEARVSEPSSAEATQLPDKSSDPAAKGVATAEPQKIAVSAEPLLQSDAHIAMQHDDPKDGSADKKKRRHGSAMPE
ncbi:MAG: DUF3306 domain-containing protein [Pseudolabrys sp.]